MSRKEVNQGIAEKIRWCVAIVNAQNISESHYRRAADFMISQGKPPHEVSKMDANADACSKNSWRFRRAIEKLTEAIR